MSEDFVTLTQLMEHNQKINERKSLAIELARLIEHDVPIPKEAIVSFCKMMANTVDAQQSLLNAVVETLLQVCDEEEARNS